MLVLLNALQAASIRHVTSPFTSHECSACPLGKTNSQSGPAGFRETSIDIVRAMMPESPPISPTISSSQLTFPTLQPIRLRQACDACTAAKVKCDKGRPACQRCLDGNELCQYSPSRRHGKRARRPKANSNQQASTISDYSSLSHSATDLFNWGAIDQISTASDTIPGFPPEDDPDFSSHISSADISLWTYLESPEALHIVDQEHTQSTSESRHDGSTSLDLRTPPSSLDKTKVNNSTEDITMSIDQPSTSTSHSNPDHAVECEARALSVLRSLQYSPGTRRMSTHNLLRSENNLNIQRLAHSVDSIETLLATNKSALSSLTQMLTCTCADNAHVALLHMTILSKIVFWYNVAVTARYCSERVDLKPMDIQTGVLDLDDEDRASLHRVVLGRELERAMGVIMRFEVRVPGCGSVVRGIREELERCIREVETR